MMLEELQRRNYAQSTVEAYVRALREFAGISNVLPINSGRNTSASFNSI